MKVTDKLYYIIYKLGDSIIIESTDRISKSSKYLYDSRYIVLKTSL